MREVSSIFFMLESCSLQSLPSLGLPFLYWIHKEELEPPSHFILIVESDWAREGRRTGVSFSEIELRLCFIVCNGAVHGDRIFLLLLTFSFLMIFCFSVFFWRFRVTFALTT